MVQEVQALCTQPPPRNERADGEDGQSADSAFRFFLKSTATGVDLPQAWVLLGLLPGPYPGPGSSPDSSPRCGETRAGGVASQMTKLLRILGQPRQGLGQRVLSCGFTLNVVGGIALREPAADLALAVSLVRSAEALRLSERSRSAPSSAARTGGLRALRFSQGGCSGDGPCPPQVSAYTSVDVSPNAVFFGEVAPQPLDGPPADQPAPRADLTSPRVRPQVGLGGELRAVPDLRRRVAEAARYGFTAAIVPKHKWSGEASVDGCEVRRSEQSCVPRAGVAARGRRWWDADQAARPQVRPCATLLQAVEFLNASSQNGRQKGHAGTRRTKEDRRDDT